MLQEYPATKCTRRCHVTGKPLEPGQSYVSVLVHSGDQLERLDIAANQWNQPPANAVGWWKCRMPIEGTARLRPAPNGVLLDVLTELLQKSGQAQLAYLLAVLLVRRRALVDDRTLVQVNPQSDQKDRWLLIHPGDGREWSVPIVLPSSAAQAAQLQQSLTSLLFTDQ